MLRTAAMLRRQRAVAAAACFAQLVASGIALLFLTPDDRLLAAPMLCVALTATVYVLTLWARDGSPPVFEVGTLCMLAIAVYGMLPMVGFLLMHGQWDPFCDARLQHYAFVPAELGSFGWRYAVYAAVF